MDSSNAGNEKYSRGISNGKDKKAFLGRIFYGNGRADGKALDLTIVFNSHFPNRTLRFSCIVLAPSLLDLHFVGLEMTNIRPLPPGYR